MDTMEMTIARIHKRTREMKQQRTRRLLRIESAVTGALGVCLIAMLVLVGGSSGGWISDAGADTEYAGATMLDASFGGYILIGVVAFLFGAALAILIRTFHEKHKQDLDDMMKKET